MSRCCGWGPLVCCSVGTGLILLGARMASAADWYVSPAGCHANSGQSLAQAFQSIPQAMTHVSDGDTIWVDAGTYDFDLDCYPVGAELRARWAIYKAVTVRSLHGADLTFVVGQRHSADAALGDFAMRGVYLADNATLMGVTIVNGNTKTYSSEPTDLYGGGILAASPSAEVYDCVIRDCSANSMGGGRIGERTRGPASSTIRFLSACWMEGGASRRPRCTIATWSATSFMAI